MLNRPLPAPHRDVLLLVARTVLAVIMLAHGLHTLTVRGLGPTVQDFEAMSIPVPVATASFVTVVETLGGVLLLAGALTPVVGACIFVVMVGAAGFVHLQNGVLVAADGWELVGALGAGSLALIAVGPGRYSVDHLVTRRREARREGLRLAGWPVRQRDAGTGRRDAPPAVQPAVPSPAPPTVPPPRSPAVPAAAAPVPDQVDLWTPTEDVPVRSRLVPLDDDDTHTRPVPVMAPATPKRTRRLGGPSRR